MMDREITVDSRKIAALDKARDYDAASSYNFLNAELRWMCGAVGTGAVVAIEDEAGRFTLRSVGEVVAWARGRYPHAKPR